MSEGVSEGVSKRGSESFTHDGWLAAADVYMRQRLRHQCAYRRQQHFHHAQSTACAPKVYDGALRGWRGWEFASVRE